MQKPIPGKNRSTNIECLRCILMLMIITHHYVVNSGIVFFNDLVFDSELSRNVILNTIMAQLFGWGGKAGIDTFIIITGYYMCTQSASLRKWLGLLSEVIFYNLIINGLFLAFGYCPYGKIELIKGMLSAELITGLKMGSDNFVSYYLLLYLLIPYINKCINNITKEEYEKLIAILFLVYSVVTTLTISKINTFSGLGCYVLLYLIGGYIKIHQLKYDSFMWGMIGVIISILVVCLSIFASDYLNYKFGIGGGGYALVDQINKVIPIVYALSLFVVFKNIGIPYNLLINTFASTTLGILCIHANSATMRKFLWGKVLKVSNLQSESVWRFAISIVVIPATIFLLCGIIDLGRQRLKNTVKTWLPL